MKKKKQAFTAFCTSMKKKKKNSKSLVIRMGTFVVSGAKIETIVQDDGLLTGRFGETFRQTASFLWCG